MGRSPWVADSDTTERLKMRAHTWSKRPSYSPQRDARAPPSPQGTPIPFKALPERSGVPRGVPPAPLLALARWASSKRPA